MTSTEFYTDAQGNRYKVVGHCPYSELTPGSPFVLIGERTVRFRGEAGPRDFPNLQAALPGLVSALRNTPVIALLWIGSGDEG